LIKPDPQIFRLLLEKTGRKAEECVFVDDSAANVEAAKQLGFSAIRFESPEQLERALSEIIELTPNSAK
jgi:FMN phosphatase YigB (HAD superfamily)